MKNFTLKQTIKTSPKLKKLIFQVNFDKNLFLKKYTNILKNINKYKVFKKVLKNIKISNSLYFKYIIFFLT